MKIRNKRRYWREVQLQHELFLHELLKFKKKFYTWVFPVSEIFWPFFTFFGRWNTLEKLFFNFSIFYWKRRKQIFSKIEKYFFHFSISWKMFKYCFMKSDSKSGFSSTTLLASQFPPTLTQEKIKFFASITHFTVGLRVPSTSVEKFCAKDNVNVAHEQQHVLVMFPSTLVLVPNLFSTNAKSFRYKRYKKCN